MASIKVEEGTAPAAAAGAAAPAVAAAPAAGAGAAAEGAAADVSMTEAVEEEEPKTPEPLPEKVSFPIVYGSMSFWLGKKADEYKTHRWSVYVRGLNNEDLSPIIKSVALTLHPSFKMPVRELDEAPFMVTEYGWGEFEVGIKITLNTPDDQTMEMRHMLVLFPPEGSTMSTKVPVMSECYDEIVWHNPTAEVFRQIRQVKKKLGGAIENNMTVFSEQQQVLRIQAAMRRVHAETELLKERYKIGCVEVDLLRNNVEAVARKKQRTNTPTPTRGPTTPLKK